mgnify:CR=1 FL=1
METEFNLEVNGLILSGSQSIYGLSLTIKSGMPNVASEEDVTRRLISLAHIMQDRFPAEAKKENGLTIGLQADELYEIYECRVRCRVIKGDEEDSWTYGGDLRVRRYMAGNDAHSEKIYFNEDCTRFCSTIEFSRPFGSSALPGDEDF